MSEEKPSSVKKKRRLQLTGPDDQYAKRDAVKRDAAKEKSPIAPAQEPTPKPETAKLKVAKASTEKQTATAVPQNSSPKKTASNTQIPVNLRLPIGEPLTARLTALAEKHGQAIEPILKTARGRAAERFNGMIEGDAKPEPTECETGGEITRFATTFIGENADRLNAWFDPFGLGVAKDGIKPIMTKLLQDEIAKICDTVD